MADCYIFLALFANANSSLARQLSVMPYFYCSYSTTHTMLQPLLVEFPCLLVNGSI